MEPPKWYTHPALEYYPELRGIPGFITLQPTVDIDAVIFRLFPESSWKAFKMQYQVGAVGVRYRVAKGALEVEVFVEKEPYPGPENDLSQGVDCVCVLWMGEASEVLKLDQKPSSWERFEMYTHYYKALSIPLPQEPAMALYSSLIVKEGEEE